MRLSSEIPMASFQLALTYSGVGGYPLDSYKWIGMGWDGWMDRSLVIIGHRSSPSTFGGN